MEVVADFDARENMLECRRSFITYMFQLNTNSETPLYIFEVKYLYQI